MSDRAEPQRIDPDADSPIQSLDTTFRIVDALQELDGGRITDLAAATGLSKSAVHKHLATLKAHGYVVKEGTEYRLGFQFLNLGGYVRSQFPSAPFVKGKIQELATETGEVAQCMTEEHGRAFVLYRETGKNGVPTRTRAGKQMYLHQTASGKAILSQLSRERVDEIVDRHGLPEATETTITDREALYEELEATDERGVAFSYGESTRGLYAVAAPVTMPGGSVLCACVISGPSHRMEGDRMTEEYPDLLLSIVNEIELNIAHA